MHDSTYSQAWTIFAGLLNDLGAETARASANAYLDSVANTEPETWSWAWGMYCGMQYFNQPNPGGPVNEALDAWNESEGRLLHRDAECGWAFEG